MTLAHQPSMWDVAEEAGAHPAGRAGHPAPLSRGAWVDHLPGWVEGSDQVLDVLLGDIGWREDRRQMYEREVEVPRLLCWYGATSAPPPAAHRGPARPDAHYGPELGEPFVTAGLCLYRDGRDSVAWHGDRIGRGRTEDTMVAIVSFGSPAAAAAATARRRREPALPPRPRRPARDGRLLPAHLGARIPKTTSPLDRGSASSSGPRGVA